MPGGASVAQPDPGRCVCACVSTAARVLCGGMGKRLLVVAAVLGGCRGCRQQPVTACVIHAGAAGG